MSKTLEIDSDQLEQITKLRTEGKKWDEIGEAMGMATGKAMLIFDSGQVGKGEKIKDATPADVKRLRDDLVLSWGKISVRCGLPESTCRGMYRQAGGNDKGNRIGKGGRHPGTVNGETSPKSGKAAKAAKAAPAPSTFVSPVADIESLEDMKAKIEGYAIKVSLGGSEVDTVGVRLVKKVAGGKILLVDNKTGASRTIKSAAVMAVSAKKIKLSA